MLGTKDFLAINLKAIYQKALSYIVFNFFVSYFDLDVFLNGKPTKSKIFPLSNDI